MSEIDDALRRNEVLRDVADRYCEEAQELKECLEESNMLHLSTVRLISKMEKEQVRLQTDLELVEEAYDDECDENKRIEHELRECVEALDLAQAYIRRRNIYDVTIVLDIIDKAINECTLKMEKI